MNQAGYNLTVDPEGGMVFAHEQRPIFLNIEDADPVYYRLALIMTLDPSLTERAARACTSATATTKVAKLAPSEFNGIPAVFVIVECLHESPTAFVGQLPRYLEILVHGLGQVAAGIQGG